MALETKSQGIGGLDGFVTTPIDEKGRIIFPKEMREVLGADFVIRKAKGVNLEAVKKETHERDVAAVESLADSVWKERYLRILRGTAFKTINADPQGRVVVPQRLREQLKLAGKVILVGSGEKVEIWNVGDWDEWLDNPAYGAEKEELWDEISQKMKQAGRQVEE
jgi:MraZ protein